MNWYDAMEEAYNKGYKKGQEEAQKEPQQWIPVTERLPERDQEVIVFSGDYLEPKVFAYHFWGEKFSSWKGITHWMPMPEIPKEERHV